MDQPQDEFLSHDQTVQWESTVICSGYNSDTGSSGGCGPRCQTQRA